MSVVSPCINVCVSDPETDLCYGCSRTTKEIKEWSQKTKFVLSLKDKWNLIGGVPKTSAKNMNKDFWNLFKEFFNKKSLFFSSRNKRVRSKLYF